MRKNRGYYASLLYLRSGTWGLGRDRVVNYELCVSCERLWIVCGEDDVGVGGNIGLKIVM